MGPEDKVDSTNNFESIAAIPGLDLDIISSGVDSKESKLKKVPYSKPIPRNFQAQWNETTGTSKNRTQFLLKKRLLNVHILKL